MAMTRSTAKERLLAVIDALPDEALAEVASFAEFQRTKLESQNHQTEGSDSPPYLPVKVSGLWEGIQISDKDIAEVRREMWEGFGDRGL